MHVKHTMLRLSNDCSLNARKYVEATALSFSSQLQPLCKENLLAWHACRSCLACAQVVYACVKCACLMSLPPCSLYVRKCAEATVLTFSGQLQPLCKGSRLGSDAIREPAAAAWCEPRMHAHAWQE